MKEKFTALLKHRLFPTVVVSLISLGIVFYAYYFRIAPILEERREIVKNIESINKKKLMRETGELKKKKKSLNDKYAAARASLKKYDGQIYTDKYSISVDILQKLNRHGFNIYDYKLNKSYDGLKLTISGSYLNLIKFFDFLQTVKANINIEEYKVRLKDDKMYIDIKLKIGVLKL